MGAHRMNNKQKVLFVCFRKYGKDKKTLIAFRLTWVLYFISLFNVFCSLLVCAILPSNQSLFHSKSPCLAPSQRHICFHNTTFFLADYSLALISLFSLKVRQFFPSSLFISLLPNPWGPTLTSCISSSFTFNWGLTLLSQKGWARVEVLCICPPTKHTRGKIETLKKYSETSGWKCHFATSTSSENARKFGGLPSLSYSPQSG